MDPLLIAVIVAVFTLIVLFSGIPIAFGLSFVSIALLVAFEGFQMLDVFAETFYAGLNSFVLLSIPMFILMGMALILVHLSVDTDNLETVVKVVHGDWKNI